MRVQQLTGLLFQSPDAIMVVDVAKRISEWNPASEAMLGWSRAEILGMPIRQYVLSECLAHFDNMWTRLASGEAAPSYETVRLHCEGTRRPVGMHMAAVRENGNFAGAVGRLRAPFRDEVLTRGSVLHNLRVA